MWAENYSRQKSVLPCVPAFDPEAVLETEILPRSAAESKDDLKKNTLIVSRVQVKVECIIKFRPQKWERDDDWNLASDHW